MRDVRSARNPHRKLDQPGLQHGSRVLSRPSSRRRLQRQVVVAGCGSSKQFQIPLMIIIAPGPSVAQGEYLVLQARVGDRTGTPKCPRASCGVAVVRVRIGVRAVLSLPAHQVLLLRPQREELSVGTKS